MLAALPSTLVSTSIPTPATARGLGRMRDGPQGSRGKVSARGGSGGREGRKGPGRGGHRGQGRAGAGSSAGESLVCAEMEDIILAGLRGQ